MGELLELVIIKDDYLEYLKLRLRLRSKSSFKEIEKVNFPFLFASGSELLRSYILMETGFVSTLSDEYRLPDRGFIWYLFSQAVKQIEAYEDRAVIKYELLEDYRKPFKQFYM